MTNIYTNHSFIQVQENFQTVDKKIFNAAKSTTPFIRVKATHINQNVYPEPKLVLINYQLIEAIEDVHAQLGD